MPLTQLRSAHQDQEDLKPSLYNLNTPIRLLNFVKDLSCDEDCALIRTGTLGPPDQILVDKHPRYAQEYYLTGGCCITYNPKALDDSKADNPVELTTLAGESSSTFTRRQGRTWEGVWIDGTGIMMKDLLTSGSVERIRNFHPLPATLPQASPASSQPEGEFRYTLSQDELPVKNSKLVSYRTRLGSCL
jgi:hypothetical protein